MAIWLAVTIVVVAIDQVAEPSVAVKIDDMSVSLMDESIVELVGGIAGGTSMSDDVERVEEEPSETLTVALPTLIVTELEYDVVPSVMKGYATLEEVVNRIVLRASVPVVLGRPVLVSDDCPEVTVVGNMYSVPSVVLINPVETAVDRPVEGDIVPSVITGITTGKVLVNVTRVKEDDDLGNGPDELAVDEPREEATTEVVSWIVDVILVGVPFSTVENTITVDEVVGRVTSEV